MITHIDHPALKEKGVEFTMEPRDATAVKRIAFFKDPDGFLVELVQR